MAWYNKYRPTEFDDVIGQELVKKVLQNALNTNTIKHAYLFSGPKGIGKTTLARIFASNLNEFNQNPEAKLDLIELDAASNTGIDNIRQLIENAQVPPISGKYKIYIIDEVHMLSKAAMNALLKTLEEPPEKVIFLLATTNPEKLIPTVLSRLTKLPLNSHTTKDIISRLKFIAESEGVSIDEESLNIIAKRSGGSQRDAINLIETISSYSLEKYTASDTASILGLASDELMDKTIQKLLSNSIDQDLVTEIENTGLDGVSFMAQILEYLIDQSFNSNSENEVLILPVSEVLTKKLPTSSILSLLILTKQHINSATSDVKKNLNPRPIESVLKVDPIPYKKEVDYPPVDGFGDTEKLPSIETEQINKQESKQNSENDKAQEIQPATSQKKETITSDIKDFRLGSLSMNPKCPPILKMMLTDLQIEFESNVAKLSVSNGLFLGQLKSASIQNYIQNSILETTGQTFEITSDIRTKKEVIISESPVKDEVESGSFYQQEETSISENKAEEVKPEKRKNLKAGSIFYKVYKTMPENAAGRGLEIYDQEIPKPEKTSLATKAWEDDVEDIFEFE